MNTSPPSVQSEFAFLRRTVEMSPSGMLILDEAGDVIVANEKLKSCLNLDLTASASMTNLGRVKAHLKNNTLDTEALERLWSQLEKEPEAETTVEITTIRPYRQLLEVAVHPVKAGSGPLVGTMWTFTDKTRSNVLDASRLQAQKLEAMGRLAGGLAHDFNNLLTVVLGNAAMLEQRRKELGIEELEADPGSIKNCTAMISRAGGRAAELVRHLLGYSRRTQLRRETADVNEIILDVCDEVRELLQQDIELNIDLAQDLFPVRVDVSQIKQALTNVCVNAVEAVTENSGDIRIFSRNLQLADPRRAAACRLEMGDYVVITVKDTGCGVSTELQNRVFEPFFSTKEQGKGAGLGLACAMGVIQQHKGWIDFSSASGKGTVFNIYLPVATASTELAAASPSPREDFDSSFPDAALDDEPGIRTVLLVDDEPSVRAVPERLLAKKGFKVITADDGNQALEVISRHHDEIDLIISDLTMPNLTGKGLCAELRRRKIAIPVILCSGFLPDWEEFEVETGGSAAAFIQKPYSLNRLFETVQAVLS